MYRYWVVHIAKVFRAGGNLLSAVVETLLNFILQGSCWWPIVRDGNGCVHRPIFGPPNTKF